MIVEIEQKFVPGPEQLTALLDGATKVADFTMHDIYYDTVDYRLTTKDIWLRNRGGAWECKLPAGEMQGRSTTTRQYRELTTEAEIQEYLQLPQDGGDLQIALERAGFRPIAEYRTQRTKYQKDGLTIDVDRTDFGFDVVEIELEVDSAQANDAMAQIAAFAARYELEAVPVRGKMIEYLYRYEPHHYQALVEAGLV